MIYILYYSAVEFYRLRERERHFISCDRHRSISSLIDISTEMFVKRNRIRGWKIWKREIWNRSSSRLELERSEYPWKSNQKLGLKSNDGRQERSSDIGFAHVYRDMYDTSSVNLWFIILRETINFTFNLTFFFIINDSKWNLKF